VKVIFHHLNVLNTFLVFLYSLIALKNSSLRFSEVVFIIQLSEKLLEAISVSSGGAEQT